MKTHAPIKPLTFILPNGSTIKLLSPWKVRLTYLNSSVTTSKNLSKILIQKKLKA
jgi:hypothetical protein